MNFLFIFNFGSVEAVDEGVLKECWKALDDLSPDEAAKLMTAALAQLASSIPEDEDEGPDFALLSMSKGGDKIKIETFEKKKQCIRRYKKLSEKKTVVVVKGGQVYSDKCHGEPRKVIFLIGTAFGKGWCNLGPLDDKGSPYRIFKDDDDDDDDGNDSGDDDEDDAWHLIRVNKTGGGIKDVEIPNRKKAKKTQDKMEKKNVISILVHGNKVKDYTKPKNDHDEKVLTFLIGVAFGKGIVEDLGPLEDGSDMAILDDDFEVNDDDDN